MASLPAVAVTVAFTIFTLSLPFKATLAAVTVRLSAVMTRSSLDTTACLALPVMVSLPEPLTVRSALLNTAASTSVSPSV